MRLGFSGQDGKKISNGPPVTGQSSNDAVVDIPTSEQDVALIEATKPPSSWSEQFSDNQFLAAGVGVVGLTAAIAIGRKSFTTLSKAALHHYLVTLEIPIRDQAYPWFLQWIHHHQRQLSTHVLSSITSATATVPKISPWTSPLEYILTRWTPRSHHLSVATTLSRHDNGSITTSFSLLPGIGNHIFRYKNALIRMSRTRELKNLDPNGIPWETISLTTLFSQREVFTSLLSDAQHLALKSQEGKTVIYTSWGTEWRPFGQPRTKRPLDSVILDRGVKERIVLDIQDFLSSSKWYRDRGIPYRRGYLLYGPPGSGKSSFIQALAGDLNYDICLINLSERGLTDDRLNHLLSNLPSRSIALLEDVDAAFVDRRRQQQQQKEEVGGGGGYTGANVTFSGLLNALDGVASSEERILFLTTNWKQRLDEALIRPGRVDLEVEIDLATEWQVRRMFGRFYSRDQPGPEELEVIETQGNTDLGKLCDELCTILKKAGMFERGGSGEGGRRGISTAQLQGLFVYHKRDPEGAIKMAEMLVEQGAGG